MIPDVYSTGIELAISSLWSLMLWCILEDFFLDIVSEGSLDLFDVCYTFQNDFRYSKVRKLGQEQVARVDFLLIYNIVDQFSPDIKILNRFHISSVHAFYP